MKNREIIMDLWRQLQEKQQQLSGQPAPIADLLTQIPSRQSEFTLCCGGLTADFSKHLLDTDTLALLCDLAHASGLSNAIQAMFDGTQVNPTERRAALHVALRGHAPVNHPEIATQVQAALQQMENFVEAVQSGRWQGYSGKAITDVVNIGIGGSDLGPAMVTAALRANHHPALHTHFVSNIDPAHLSHCLTKLNPQTTLFIVASKSFGTLETLQNATLARNWLRQGGADESATAAHFVAISSNIRAAQAFGINPDNIFPMWDWVGGRFSLWSAIGLPIALATNMATFCSLLDGAAQMDRHFLETPFASNIPVIAGLLAVWYRNFWQTRSQVILPYAQDLQLLPSFLQQLSMESLGKSVTLDGQPVAAATGAVIWGSAGTNGQHSFHQLLHQGTDMIPADFIAIAQCAPDADSQAQIQHQHLLANCFSQSRALMCGKTLEQATQELLSTGMPVEQAEKLAPHRAVPGNRPSTTFVLDQLNAFNLGSLLAMYEHQVYVQSVLWHINAFDQWGVELGKQLSTPIFEALNDQSADLSEFDASTRNLISLCRHARTAGNS